MERKHPDINGRCVCPFCIKVFPYYDDQILDLDSWYLGNEERLGMRYGLDYKKHIDVRKEISRALNLGQKRNVETSANCNEGIKKPKYTD